MILVGVLDTFSLYADGVRCAIALTPDMTLVGAASDDKGLAAMMAHAPGVLLVAEQSMDLAVSVVRWAQPRSRPAIITMVAQGTESATLGAISRGASGVVDRAITASRLRQAIRVVAQGQETPYLDVFVHGELNGPGLVPRDLTRREAEAYKLLLLRRSNHEIAMGLGISEQTAKNYISRVYAKLGVGSRRELFTAAARGAWAS